MFRCCVDVCRMGLGCECRVGIVCVCVLCACVHMRRAMSTHIYDLCRGKFVPTGQEAHDAKE